MIIAFIGHSSIYSYEDIKTSIKLLLKEYASKNRFISCYLGGYGDFDELCAVACKEIKRECPNIELVYITPYLNLYEQEKIDEFKKRKKYDAYIFPPIETTPPKFAIAARNKWMMKNADLIIAYVNREYGGAYKALSEAKRYKKKVINIGKLL